MKKSKQPQTPLPPSEPDRAVEVEIYTAPPPPSQGRIIGLDCHPDTYTAAVYRGSTPHDARKLTCRENLSLQSLLDWSGQEFTNEDLFLLEAGSNSFEICRRLQDKGLRAIVLESCHVGKHAKTYADNDKMAAARIALVYLAGNAPCVWVPDATTCERRELLHAHQNAVAAHTRASNSLKSYLNQFAIRSSKRSLHSEKTRQWIFAQREWAPMQKQLIEGQLADLDHAAQSRARYVRLICTEICRDPLMLRCLKILGIGKVNAFALLSVIGDVRRFQRPEKLVAYIGLNPGQRQSGRGKNIKLGVGKRGRGDMRHLLIQGSQAVMRMGANTTLGKWAWKLFARKGNRNIAVVAVARKLLVQIWHLLAGNPPESLEADKSLTVKLQHLAYALGKDLRIEIGLIGTINQCVVELQRRIANPNPTPQPT